MRHQALPRIVSLSLGLAAFSPADELPLDSTSGDWTALAGGIPGLNIEPYRIAWDLHGNLWAMGRFRNAGSAVLPGFGRMDSLHHWGLPERASWDALWRTMPVYAGLDPRLNDLACDSGGTVWIAGSRFDGHTDWPILISFDGTTWKDESSDSFCGHVPSDCYVENVRARDAGNPVISATYLAKNSTKKVVQLARRVAGSWKEIPIPSSADVSTMQILGGDSLVIGGIGAWIWDGTNWSRMGMDSTQAATLAHSRPFPLSDGTILLYSQTSTTFSAVGVAGKFARWNGHAWSAIEQTGMNFDATEIIGVANDAAGNLLVAARTKPQHEMDSTFSMVLRLTGNGWDTLGRTRRTLHEWITTLASGPGERLAVGGSFFMVDSTLSWNLAARNRNGWMVLDSGFAGPVYTVAADRDGGIVVGGDFQGVQGRHIPYIARWNGTRWDPLGMGAGVPVRALTAHPDGGVVAAGLFQTTGSDTGQQVARWNGTSWTGFGVGFKAPASDYMIEQIYALAVDSGRGIWVGGFILGNPMLWDGSTWGSAFRVTNLSQEIFGIAVDPHGWTRLVGSEYTLDGWSPRIWTLTRPSSGELVSPFPSSVTWSVNGVVALGDSLFAYPGDFGSGPLAIEDHGVWIVHGGSIQGAARGVLGDATGNLFLTGGMTSSTSGAALPVLRWDGHRMVYFTGLTGAGSQVASDLEGRPVVVGTLSGSNGASVFRLNNARPVGIASGLPRPAETAFRQVGRNLVTTRSGRLDILAPTGKTRWSGVVHQGFSTGAIDLLPGMHLVRMGSQTVHLLVLPR